MKVVVTCADVAAATANDPVRAAAYSVVAIRMLRDLDAAFTDAGEPSLNPLTEEQADELTRVVHQYAAANPHHPMKAALHHAYLQTRADVLGAPTVN
jgi:hypothetical protein